MAKTIKVRSELWQRVEEHAKAAGYSSPEEFVEHVLEKELARVGEVAQDDAEIERRLKGLGYIE